MYFNLKQNNQGFTLIEIMITLMVIAVLASIAVPAYNSMKQQSNRSDAVSALTRVAQLQERWYSNKGTYADNLTTIGMSSTTSKEGHYDLSLTFDDTEPDEFVVTATATGPQKDDENCRTFSLDQAGRKTSEDSDGNASTGCWQK
ncbi:type IV pilin protein [Thiohalophilus thiocyanatoxydans]|uniref:Type IV pilus assembly protein PilE n=1 Tax=Thiohalophilus thiocyanatoxydans TaxID=381308 RepID=A0A4R8IE99_9GAMM|nr:type IV pilin protein [Thiohalophilus thiocyanatoxydans]TDX97924.1 type IV pilus assembly protein PilE [Thiohalophilus thiocyanatoxydans]